VRRTHEHSVISQNTWILNNTAVETAKTCVIGTSYHFSGFEFCHSLNIAYELAVNYELFSDTAGVLNCKYCCWLRSVNCVVPLFAFVTLLYV
jgi:hypothetical protein